MLVSHVSDVNPRLPTPVDDADDHLTEPGFWTASNDALWISLSQPLGSQSHSLSVNRRDKKTGAGDGWRRRSGSRDAPALAECWLESEEAKDY